MDLSWGGHEQPWLPLVALPRPARLGTADRRLCGHLVPSAQLGLSDAELGLLVLDNGNDDAEEADGRTENLDDEDLKAQQIGKRWKKHGC